MVFYIFTPNNNDDLPSILAIKMKNKKDMRSKDHHSGNNSLSCVEIEISLMRKIRLDYFVIEVLLKLWAQERGRKEMEENKWKIPFCILKWVMGKGLWAKNCAERSWVCSSTCLVIKNILFFSLNSNNSIKF